MESIFALNTIIINEAHQFRLSDLHQMRGRVGRSNKKAFCYLAPPLAALNSQLNSAGFGDFLRLRERF